jgi:hypothetical protein
MDQDGLGMVVDIFIRFVTLIELGYGDDIEAVWWRSVY